MGKVSKITLPNELDGRICSTFGIPYGIFFIQKGPVLNLLMKIKILPMYCTYSSVLFKVGNDSADDILS